MRYKFVSILCGALLLLSCGKSTEVTIVDGSAGILPDEKPSNASTTQKTTSQDDFTVIKIGEPNSIHTLDPLFGTNNSEFRTLSLIYDGLTKIDMNGNVKPAIAKKWAISRDSLRYTFTIHDNVFYHSDSRFTSGIGRKVIPEDIIMNFERMASILVPDNAAEMFTSIKGFKSFHTEQTFIKIPENRTINSIEGITAPNDSTITIQLSKKDKDLLKKLAHPLASIYPKESLPTDKTPITKPIGTGSYYLAQQKSKLLILASNDDYFQSQEVPTRIDITHGKKEADLYQDFAKGNLDALIEIGPGTITQLTDSTGKLDFMYQSEFNLYDSSVKSEVNFYYNPQSESNNVETFLRSQTKDFLNFDRALGEVIIKDPRSSVDSLEKQNVHIAFTDNPAEVYLTDAIAKKLAGNRATVVMNSSYAITDEVTFSTKYFPSAQQTIVWKKPVLILTKEGVTGIKVSHYPWNISFDGSTITKSN
jgi:ABC-type transport system substrate-binding protein